jgi:hypothetical protein
LQEAAPAKEAGDDKAGATDDAVKPDKSGKE